MKSVDIDVTKKPSEKQIEMLRKAAKRPITFDEDCPESLFSSYIYDLIIYD